MGGFLRAHGRAIAVASVFVALLSCAPAALAWGPRGHRIVARLAETQLTPQARAEARKLLALRGARHLSDVAVWADDLRDTEPALFQRTKRLHFVNFHSRDCIYEPPRDCRDGECAVAAIDKYSAILANRGNGPAARAEALMFVVHFVATSISRCTPAFATTPAATISRCVGTGAAATCTGSGIRRCWIPRIFPPHGMCASSGPNARQWRPRERLPNGPRKAAASIAMVASIPTSTRLARPTSTASCRSPNGVCAKLGRGWRSY